MNHKVHLFTRFSFKFYFNSTCSENTPPHTLTSAWRVQIYVSGTSAQRCLFDCSVLRTARRLNPAVLYSSTHSLWWFIYSPHSPCDEQIPLPSPPVKNHHNWLYFKAVNIPPSTINSRINILSNADFTLYAYDSRHTGVFNPFYQCTMGMDWTLT